MLRTSLYIFSTLAVMLLGYWAHVENLRTRAAIDEVAALSREIGRLGAEVNVLKAEWAYLNRPDRLMDLVALNEARLGLMPLAPEQFGRVDQVAYPQTEIEVGLDGATDVNGVLPGAGPDAGPDAEEEQP